METTRNSDPFRMGSARWMRKHPTKAEEVLWLALRRKALGVRARRQYTCGPYVLDFYIPAAKMCIELDGPMHERQHDNARNEYLESRNIMTLRIPAGGFLVEPDRWMEEIEMMVRYRLASLKEGA